MKFYMENDGKVEFEREDFTDEELALLNMIFNIGEAVANTLYVSPYYETSFCNDLFNLKENLGINDLLN